MRLIVVGIGGTLLYAPSFMFVGLYFKKYSSLAFGLSSLGGAVGPAIFAPMTRFLINEYGWRGALVITSGIILNGCVSSALLCQPESWLPSRGDASNKHSVILTEKPDHFSDNNVKLSGVNRLLSLLDLDLLRSFNQWVLIFNRMTQCMSSFIWWMFLVDHAYSVGITGFQAAMSVSIVTGVSGLVSVPMAGLMLACPRLDPAAVMAFAGIGAGTASFLLPLASSVQVLYIISAMFGFCSGIYNAELGVVITKMFGSQKGTAAMSYSLVGAGTGALISPPIGGERSCNYLSLYYKTIYILEIDQCKSDIEFISIYRKTVWYQWEL